LIEKKKVVSASENAVLVGLIQKDQTEQQVNEYLDELSFLAETAGAHTVKRFTQKMARPDSKTFLGKGKLEEIKNFISFKGNIDLVIFDD
jgi:GTP-binding protein HflX